jgi:hypothetical protein
MSPLDRNLHALATCYRIGAGLLGLGISLLQPAAELAFAAAENQQTADLRPQPGYPAEG